MPVVLSKVETAKKPFRFFALSKRAKETILDFLNLEDLFCLAQCYEKGKALVASQKIPGHLTWTFSSNSLATIAFNSEGHSHNLNLNLRNVILNDSIDEYTEETINGIAVLITRVRLGRWSVCVSNEKDWMMATRGFTEMCMELFIIQSFTLNSVNFDPDELMYYLKLAPKKFNKVQISYPHNVRLNGISFASQPNLNGTNRPLHSPRFLSEVEKRENERSLLRPSFDSFWSVVKRLTCRRDDRFQVTYYNRGPGTLRFDRAKIEELVEYLKEEVEAQGDITLNLDD